MASAGGPRTRPYLPAVEGLAAVTFGAAISLLLTRGLGPALPGSALGIGAIVDRVEFASAFASQVAYVLLLLALGRLTRELVRSRAPWPIKLLGAAAAISLLVGSVTGAALPTVSLWLPLELGVTATVGGALLVGLSFGKHESRGWLAIAWVLAGIPRMAGAFHAERVLESRVDLETTARASSLASSLSTFGSAFTVLTTLAIAVHFARRRALGGLVAWLSACLTAGVVAHLSSRLPDAEESTIRFVLRRFGGAFDSLPTADFPIAARTAIGLVVPLMALAVLSQTRRDRVFYPAFGLMVLGSVSPEAPLSAVALFVGALALFVDSTDPTGAVAALRADPAGDSS